VAEVHRIRISGLESGRIQHILNKPDRIRTTVLFKFLDQDQDQVFQISFLEFDTNTIINKIFCKDLKQWLSTFFVLVHPFEFAQKPVHPCNALKYTTAKVQNLISDFYAVDVA